MITNGEGGFKYATLAERYYGAELTREGVGRARLPALRRAELLEGAGLLRPVDPTRDAIPAGGVAARTLAALRNARS